MPTRVVRRSPFDQLELTKSAPARNRGLRSSIQCSTDLAGPVQTRAMTNEFTGVVERDGEWFIAYCAEIPGANGQGHTKEEALESLSAGVALILEDRREDALRGLPADAIQERVTVK